ncbi:alpha/beta hydrolase [Hydrogenispora ethanolica]|nr:alpha/beta hydrolase [Hydrogenispora ethanolica]
MSKKYLFRILALMMPLLFVYQNCNAVPTASDGESRYLKPIFKKIKLQADIEYGKVINSEGKNQKLLLDLYAPDRDSEKNRPAIMWIHGGAFLPQNDKTKGNIVALAKEFAARGYVSISIDYRLRQNPHEDFQGMLNDTVNDAMLALEWIRKNAAAYGIDKNRIIVGGTSSGGQIAVNLCYKDQDDNGHWDKAGIIALIDLWGGINRDILGAIDKNDPPTVIVHGTKDKHDSL